nr:hypothetical protein CFP56_57205 [Quercus suber]
MFILTTASLCTLAAEAAKIDIYNEVGKGLTITARCKSIAGSLGAHEIAYGVGVYEIISENLVSCTFQWVGASHSFDIYDPKRDRIRCRYCVWLIRPGGPCLQDTDINVIRNEQYCYPWKN